MRTETVTIQGLITYGGEEYDYTAILRDSYDEGRPDEVTDIDCADGTPLPDSADFEILENLALQNAYLVDWCNRQGWEEEDTGGGCSALVKGDEDSIATRITRVDDPSVPQTMGEPVAIGRYDKDDRLLGEVRIFKGGINEWIADPSISRTSPYAETIMKVAKRLGRPDVNPRWVEAFMRLEYPSLNSVSPESFDREVKIGIACIDFVGPEKAERCANSWGL